MRHTKIVATVGPATSDHDVLDKLLAVGVDVFRLNFSHGTDESHEAVCRGVREASRRQGRQVAVLQDLSGPKIRTGPVAGGGTLTLKDGDTLCIAPGDYEGEPGRIFTPYAELIDSARPGDRLLLDDGRIELRVVEARPGELVTFVVNGGVLGGRKGINAPGVALPACAVTEKDARDLRVGLRMGIDIVALSFVQTAEDVRHALAIMDEEGRRVPLIAKIERPAAVQNLSAILDVAQGVMVARGDLGLEMPLEQVPRTQKEIIRRARALGKPVIVATQVLESMRVEPRPTRAEVSDAANAVDEGTDAIMLAGETAVGAFPVRAVQMLDLIIRETESIAPSGRTMPRVDPAGSLHGRALCEAAVTLATTGQADAIVAVTREGRTARMLSSLRPDTPIYGVTEDERVAATLALAWGVTPVIASEHDAASLERLLIDRELVPRGAVVVFINISHELNRDDSNFLHVQRLGA
ncbi:MAG: pyruvate kinase [Acidobacteria bacterium]|nr:pyruvate kinase [Acidobacteriota bacterium]